MCIKKLPGKAREWAGGGSCLPPPPESFLFPTVTAARPHSLLHARIHCCTPLINAGRSCPGCCARLQLRVVDPETREDVADGQQGLILARGPGVTRGYWNEEPATAKVRACLRGCQPALEEVEPLNSGVVVGVCVVCCPAGKKASIVSC